MLPTTELQMVGYVVNEKSNKSKNTQKWTQTRNVINEQNQ